MYHPYAQSPSALTEYLRQKLRSQCAKQLSHSHSTQVEQNIPLEHNKVHTHLQDHLNMQVDTP